MNSQPSKTAKPVAASVRVNPALPQKTRRAWSNPRHATITENSGDAQKCSQMNFNSRLERDLAPQVVEFERSIASPRPLPNSNPDHKWGVCSTGTPGLLVRIKLKTLDGPGLVPSNLPL